MTSAAPRRDGWTAERRRAFVAAIADGATVTEAAAHVRLSPSSAYRLARKPAAGAFRTAWCQAIRLSRARLTEAAYTRAIHGTVTPVFYKGAKIGERVTHDTRLLLYLLDKRGLWVPDLDPRYSTDVDHNRRLAHNLDAITPEAEKDEDEDEPEPWDALTDSPPCTLGGAGGGCLSSSGPAPAAADPPPTRHQVNGAPRRSDQAGGHGVPPARG